LRPAREKPLEKSGEGNKAMTYHRKWIERKNMPAHKVGRLWKFKKNQIDEWVEAGKAGLSPVNDSGRSPE